MIFQVQFTAEIEAATMAEAEAKARAVVAQGGNAQTKARPRPGLWQTIAPEAGRPAVAIVPRALLDRAAQCIARAEADGAFKDCAAPQIGARTLAWLESVNP